MKKYLLMFTLGIAFSCSAYANNMTVITSFSILDDMVKNIGGDKVKVMNLVGADEDVHHYEFKPKDIQYFATDNEAQLFFTHGLGIDPWVSNLVKASSFKGKVITVSDGITPRRLHQEEGSGYHQHHHDHHKHEEHHSNHHDDEHEHSDDGHDGEKNASHEHQHTHHGDIDPHAWQSLKNAQIYVDNIVSALSDADKENAMFYQKNARRYKEEMQELDKALISQFMTLPDNHRYLVTSHEALGYFADAYGLKVLTPLGFSSDAEPSAKEMVKVIKTIRTLKVPTIFLENTQNPKLIEQIARESGAKVGGTLYTDALTSSGEGVTYLGMMKSNARVIFEGLK